MAQGGRYRPGTGLLRLCSALGLALLLGLSPAGGAERASANQPLLPPMAPERGKANAVTVYGGVAAVTDFTTIITQPWRVDWVKVRFIGASYSRRIGTLRDVFGSWGESFAIEAEAGAGLRFGSESLGEFWGAAYLRFDAFPWNDIVYTTIAGSLGLNQLTRSSPYERRRNSGGNNSNLLHYFAPEITIADPDNKDLEAVFRLHHRSGVFGLFNGVSTGSNILTIGVRKRF